MDIKEFDEKEIYCRKLGHHVPFLYCRKGDTNIACHKIIDCWFEKIDINSYIDEYFSDDEKQNLNTPPKPKILSIYEIMKNAQNINKK